MDAQNKVDIVHFTWYNISIDCKFNRRFMEIVVLMVIGFIVGYFIGMIV